jgi:hypothetical protein
MRGNELIRGGKTGSDDVELLIELFTPFPNRQEGEIPMSKSSRGRKPVCNASQRRHVAALVKRHSALQTAKILAAKNGTEKAKLRSVKQFPKPVVISVPTLCTYARDHGVELHRGRRAA